MYFNPIPYLLICVENHLLGDALPHVIYCPLICMCWETSVSSWVIKERAYLIFWEQQQNIALFACQDGRTNLIKRCCARQAAAEGNICAFSCFFPFGKYPFRRRCVGCCMHRVLGPTLSLTKALIEDQRSASHCDADRSAAREVLIPHFNE